MMRRGAFCAAALLLVGCAGNPFVPQRPGAVVGTQAPMNRAQAQPVVMRRGPFPQVITPMPGGLPPCPPQLANQAQWLARNLVRVRLGMTKLEVAGIAGNPARAETFGLTNGATVEVLFYHTPETICRVNSLDAGLLPMVFQNDRLLGYGQGYYKAFIAPLVPEAAVAAPERVAAPVPEAEPLPPGPSGVGRLVQEDLPTPPGTMRQGVAGGAGAVGYSGGMSTSVGRGDPLQ